MRRRLSIAARVLRESREKTGRAWDVVVLEEGVSANGLLYTAEALREAVDHFEGLSVAAYDLAPILDHLPTQDRRRAALEGPVTKAVVGVLTEARIGEVDGKVAILASLHVLDSAGWFRDYMKSTWDLQAGVPGFSIDGDGAISESGEVTWLRKLHEVTVVAHPAAGGRVVRLAASARNGMKHLLEKARLFYPGLYESVGEEGFTKAIREAAQKKGILKEMEDGAVTVQLPDDEGEAMEEVAAVLVDASAALTAVAETPEGEMAAAAVADAAAEVAEEAAVVKGEKPKPMAEGGEKPKPEPVLTEAQKELKEAKKLRREIEVERSTARLETALASSQLPSSAQDRIRSAHRDQVLTESQVKSAISDEEKYIDAITRSGEPNMPAIRGGTERLDRVGIAISRSFGVALTESQQSAAQRERIEPFPSMRRLIGEFYGGDEAVRTGLGRGRNVRAGGKHFSCLLEALTTGDLGEVYADRQEKSLLMEYNAKGGMWDLATARAIASFGPASSLKTIRTIRWGGYADPGVVAESADYPSASAVTDIEETFTLDKVGMVETVTEEMLWDDDKSLGFVAKIGPKFAVAAKRRLYKLIFDLLTGNANMADGVAIFHSSSHGGNLLTTAMDQAAISAARVKMLKQTERNSSERIGLVGNIILTSVDLYPDVLVELNTRQVTGSENNDLSPIADDGIQVFSISHWTDANDWYLLADKSQAELIRVAFFGPEEPEIFVQDDPRTGSRFSADKIQYKLRHGPYGAGVVDYRPAVRHSVS